MKSVRALTLIEVMLGMGLLTLGIATIVMALPTALRVQERSRFMLLASAKAQEVIDRFGNSAVTNTASTEEPPYAHAYGRSLSFEARYPWDTQGGRRILDPDLEANAAVINGPLIPLPHAIAYRLDSPGDEIRKLLDAGGQVYYANPVSANPTRLDGPVSPRPPSESIRLVVAVQGYAQQNAIQHYPWKDWPYYIPYPSPPQYTSGVSAYDDGQYRSNRWARCEESFIDGDSDSFNVFDYDLRGTLGDGRPFNYTGTMNRRGAQTSSGTKNFGGGMGNNYSDNQVVMTRPWILAKSQTVLALWYAARKNVPQALLWGADPIAPADIATCVQNPKMIRALRYLAHTGACLTKWYPLAPEPSRGPRSAPWRNQDYWASTPTTARTLILADRPSHDGLINGIPLPGDDDPLLSPRINPTRVWPKLPYYPTLNELLTANMADGVIGQPNLPAAPAGYFDALSLPPVPRKHPSLVRTGFQRTVMSSPIDGLPDDYDGHLYVDTRIIHRWHDACMAAVMAYSAQNPYDWSEPRPYERQIFTDNPLLQWDIISDDPMSGDISGIPDAGLGLTTAITATSWRPIAARPITNQGATGMGLDLSSQNNRANGMDYASIKGDESHFNLARPFDPSERCRQMVFYMVNWTAYRDVETAPSATVDASRYPRWTSSMATEWGRRWYENPTMSDRMWNRGNWFESNMVSLRNPEKVRNYVIDMNANDMATGRNILYLTAGPDGKHDVNQTEREAFIYRNGSTQSGTESDWWRIDLGPTTRNSVLGGVYPVDNRHPRFMFSGLFGADRNVNSMLDRGPLPPTTRLRAVEVSRINFYDPRLAMQFR